MGYLPYSRLFFRGERSLLTYSVQKAIINLMQAEGLV